MKTFGSIFALVCLLAFGGCSSGQTLAPTPASIESDATTLATSQSSSSSAAPDLQSSESEPVAPAETAEEAQPAPTNAPSASQFVVTIGNTQLAVALADTDAARALAQHLQEGPTTVNLHEYGGFEMVGALPWSLPASDQQVTTQPGDVMLYQGNQITFFTGSNSWAYTPLGQVVGQTDTALTDVLSGESISVELSLAAA